MVVTNAKTLFSGRPRWAQVNGRRGLAFLAVLSLAGCVGPPASTSGPSVTDDAMAPIIVDLQASNCGNLVLFQLVDFKPTEAYLPPGFHPRDASELLGNPTVVGKTALVLVTLDCAVAGHADRWRPSFLEIFVDAPVVPEVNGTARFDFYEVERYGDPEELGGALREAGWHVLSSQNSLNLTVVSGKMVMGEARISDNQGTLISAMGAAPAPLNLDFGQLRFWQQNERGLGYFDTAFPLNPGTGGAYCTMRAGSIAAKLTGATTCPPGTPLLASFENLAFESHFVFLPGVLAR